MEKITFECPECGHGLAVAPEKAGKKARCPRCSHILTIPGPSTAVKPAAKAAAAPPAPAPAPGSPAPAPSLDLDDEDGKAYGLIDQPAPPPEEPKPRKKKPRRDEDEDEEDEDEDEDEEDEEDKKDEDEFDETGKRLSKKEEKLKITLSKEKKAGLRKVVADPEGWRKVQLGVLLVAISVIIWMTAFFLRCLVFLIGTSGSSEYAFLASTELVSPETPPQPGHFPELNRAPFLVGLIGGSEYYSACLWMIRIAYFLTLIQLLVAGAGYAFCLGIPQKSNLRGVIIGCLVLTFFNFIFVLVWRLLPMTGLISYTLIPYLVPEVALLDINIERLEAVHLAWSSAPFWESFFAIFMHLALYLEPVLFCVFLYYAAKMIKDRPMETDADGLIQLGLGCAFMVLAFQLLINAGSSEVVIGIFRFVYILFLCFFTGQLIWYVIYLFQSRQRIDKALKV